MVVYIFPVDYEKVKHGEIDAGVVDAKIRSLGITPKNVDPTWRETANTVKRIRPRRGKVLPENWVQLYTYGLIGEEYIEEVDEAPSIIIVDQNLGFTSDDIPDDQSFGNGVSIGGIVLKDGRYVECGWVVFDHADREKADKLLSRIRDIFMGKL
jgi:hypothetical protein